MYKLLPILLFVFLLAEEKSAPLIIQSDSLDFIWAEEQLDLSINEFKKQVANIINEDKFLINVDRKVNEVVRVDTTYHEMNTIKYRIIIDYKINIEVNIDKSIELDNSVKQTIESIINIIFQFSKWKIENITFNSVDINKLKNKNKQLSLNRDDIYDDSWAVIIGIDKYKYSDQLNYAVKDAEAVKDMLISKFDFPEKNIRYLTNEEATLSNIKLNLGEVATSAGENDRILVFYSGHGETLKGADGSAKGYIIPYEGRQDNPFGTGFAMDEILTTSQVSNSKHMLFLMDACYSGLMTERGKGLAKPKGERALLKLANKKARQIITAGGRDEQVIERDEWQHSAFTKNLLAGLDDWEADPNNRGYVTADELGTYLRENVIIDSDEQQIPQKGRFLNSGGGEFVFFSNHRENKPNLVDKVRKSNGDDIVVQKAVDGKQGWFEKYGYEDHGIEFVALEGLYQIGFVETIHKEWFVGFFYSHLEYSHLENNFLVDIIGLAPDESHSLIINSYMMDLGYKYFITDRIIPFIAGDVIYNMISFKDVAEETSGDKNLIIFSASGGMWISIFQFDHGSFPMTLGTRVAITSLYSPSSYENYDGILTFDDWEIRLVPSLHLTFTFPK